MEITGLGFKSWKHLEKGRGKKKNKANTVGSLGGIKKKRVFRQSVVRIVVWKYDPKGRVSRETMGKE